MSVDAIFQNGKSKDVGALSNRDVYVMMDIDKVLAALKRILPEYY